MNRAADMLAALFQSAPNDAFINLRMISPRDQRVVEEFVPADKVARAAEWAIARASAGDVYVGVLPRSRKAGGRDAIPHGQCVWVDCDRPEAVAALEQFELRPSMVVASGSASNVHAYWLLTEAVQVDRIEEINRRLQHEFGSDTVYDAPRILRVPGTLNHKHDLPTDVVLMDCNRAQHTIDEIEDALPEVDSGLADLFPDDPKGHGNRGLSAVLVDIAHDAGVVLFHDPGNTAYARVPVGDHHEVWTLGSRKFKRWLRHELHHREGRMAKSDALSEAIELLSAQADFDGPEAEVELRSSWVPGGLAYNLADAGGHVVTVTPDGWTVGVDADAMFLRHTSVQALPVPERGGSINLLSRYINVESDEDFMLIVAWLLMTLRPTGPYPALVIQGQQGSAKSTLARLLKALVDPVKAPVRSLPASLHDLAIMADSNWVVVIDNLSLLKDHMSDAFCRLATGGGFATRALYTDDEERIFEQMRAAILNGIDAVVTRQDLLGRSIVLRLPKISKQARLDEETFWAQFEADQPKILGALLDGASAALASWETTKVEGLRMADFARWAAAAVPAYGWTAESFVEAYEENLSGALKASLEGSVLATVLMRLAHTGGLPIEGEPTLVRKKLRDTLSEEETKSRDFPTNAQVMSRALTLLSPALAEIGIEVITTKRGTGNAKSRWISIRAIPSDGTQGTHGTPPSDGPEPPTTQ